jgi:hypothetical protein
MRTLLLAVSALTLCALAACSRQAPSADSPAAAAAPGRQPQPAVTSARPSRPVTQASAVTSGDGADGGAYGMPRAPIPYNELGVYERARQGRQDPTASPQPGQPGQPPAPPKTQTTKPRTADTVFY